MGGQFGAAVVENPIKTFLVFARDLTHCEER
jgi:hypothetical protein